MAGMVLLMKYLLMIIGITARCTRTAGELRTLQLKDDDIKHSNTTLWYFVTTCSYFGNSVYLEIS
jgi:hypothetical protein